MPAKDLSEREIAKLHKALAQAKRQQEKAANELALARNAVYQANKSLSDKQNELDSLQRSLHVIRNTQSNRERDLQQATSLVSKYQTILADRTSQRKNQRQHESALEKRARLLEQLRKLEQTINETLDE